MDASSLAPKTDASIASVSLDRITELTRFLFEDGDDFDFDARVSWEACDLNG